LLKIVPFYAISLPASLTAFGSKENGGKVFIGIIAPKFEELFNGFKVSLFKQKSAEIKNVVDNVVDNRLSRIINLIKSNNQITANQIAKLLDITSRTAQRDLEKLTKLKSIKRKGSAKGGYWEIINE
jgi:ATP-dependent DNA helicase RecG